LNSMIDLLCTIMIPSRKRPDGLDRCITSVVETASDEGNYEILVRIDDDDDTNSEVIEKYKDHPIVKITTGPRLGYDQLDTGYYTQLANSGRGKWCWIVNDDMVFITEPGVKWDRAMKHVPPSHIIQPEIHGLRQSKYAYDNRTGSPCFQNGCWIQAGWPHIPPKADYVLTQKLEEMGWKPWFISGLTIWHDREEDCPKWKVTHA
jgi:glycosyltransferase involved in cell wall biosynthesis